MTPADLLSEVRARHVELMVVGDRLLIRPAQALPTDLRAELRAKTAEVVALLKAQGGLGLADALPGGVSEARPSLLVAEVVGMRLSEFARARLVVAVRSAVLDEVVVFASDNAVVDPGEQRVVYRSAELRELLGLSPKELRVVHRAKQTFRGTVLS